MFKKILIANRGEIALRIIRACKELGIKTVAIYSEEDRDSLHVRYADEVFCIGPAAAKDSYLNLANIISTAELLGVDAIHPGYGLLSEDPTFANLCAECNIKFIGPKKEVIEKMNNKVEAKKIANKVGVPTLSGTLDEKISEFELIKQARKIGFPLMIKQLDGGGGSGIEIVNNMNELKTTYHKIKEKLREVTGKINKEIYIERYLTHPRHIEVQIAADNDGNIVYLSERDCSLQRRRQKLIEEGPAYSLSEDLRHTLARSAIKIAKEINFDNVGTVEFLVDENKKDFYFIEMNTRIQVEHTVTEEIIGIDLVKEQIRLANNERLRINQLQTKPRGHAIQCRINAEDPDNNFFPSPGDIKRVIFPGGIGVRIDTHIYQGYRISPYYDSLIAKVIVHAKDREEAISRMKRALSEFEIEGIKTTIPFYQKLLADEDYLKGNIHTNFVEEFIIRNYERKNK